MLAISILGPRTAGAETGRMLAALPAQALDLVVLRPLGTARLVAGALLWVPVSVVQAFVDAGNAAFAPTVPPEEAARSGVQETLDIFVVEPARYVFERPLGEQLDGI